MAKYEFYNTSAWDKIRQLVIERAGGICEICGFEKGNIVHHVVEVNDSNINDMEIVYGLDNLKCVCQCCHNQIHHKSKENNKLIFDKDGLLVDRI